MRLKDALDVMKRLLIGDYQIERFEILAIHQESRARATFAEMDEIGLTVKKMQMHTKTLLRIFFLPDIQMKARVG
jgi:hypothetical protein